MLAHPVKRALHLTFVAVALLAMTGAASLASAQTTVVKWNEVLLQCLRTAKLGPPMVARAIGITHTCGFDSWAMYDDVAQSTRIGGALRRPPDERTQANKERAYSYGVYRALLDLFPGQTDFIRSQMAAIGYDPDDNSTDPASPAGVGNVCAAAVTTFRHGDGANQLGDLHPGAYSDYTGYAPVNTVDQIIDPNHWQPLRFCDGHGGFTTPGYVAPQWGNVIPFSLTSGSDLRPGPPARYPQGGYIAQLEKIIQLTAHLDDTEKMIAEFWADGPGTAAPPGHWMQFGEWVSARDHHTFDEDVKMFFTLGNAEMDAAIVVWDAKRAYDSERPITAIHFIKAGKKIQGYVPFVGRQVINGEDWLPYQPCNFVTPPFPEYPSGHSGFSAAGAEILKRFTGSDAFGNSVTFAPGSGRLEPGFAPSQTVTLAWATFSDAADEAGMSRRFGGIHFEDGDLTSRALGREVGARVWDKAMSYINGTAFGPIEAAAGLATPEASAPQTASASEVFAIRSITPNPASAEARIEYVVARAAEVRLSIVDIQGRELAVLAAGIMSPGAHTAVWSRAGAAAGMYFVRYQTPAGSMVRRLAIVH
jgi:hypothetical protein